MLTFSSKVDLKPDCSRQTIIDMLGNWFIESELAKDWMQQKSCNPFETYQQGEDFSDRTDNLSIDITNDPAFMLVEIKTETNIYKRNTFCLYKDPATGECPTLNVGEIMDQKMLDTSIICSDTCKFTVGILQNIYWNGYQSDMDGDIENSDRTIFITMANAQKYQNIMKMQGAHELPFAYIPYEYSKNVTMWESDFVGQMHILAAGSPFVKNKLADGDDATEYDTPRVSWSDGNSVPIDTAICEQAEQFVPFVKNLLQEHVVSCESAQIISLSKLKESRLRAKLGDDSEMSEIFETILQEKDSAIADLESEVSLLRTALRDEQLKTDALAKGYDKAGNSDTGMFKMEEKPKYEHEVEDIILKILEKERDGMSGDPNLIKSRKYHVLCDILAHNFPSGTDAEITKIIKSVFGDGRLTRDGIGRLQSAGFSVVKTDRQSHYKITWLDDDRYVMTYSFTPSDWRSGKNGASLFSNLCVGY